MSVVLGLYFRIILFPFSLAISSLSDEGKDAQRRDNAASAVRKKPLTYAQ